MRIRNRRERRQKHRAQERVKHLTTCIKEQGAQIAGIQNSTLDARCTELNIPAPQKSALKEIITAASKKNANGHRYTEEWIMLCMLMNIRSPGLRVFFAQEWYLTITMYKNDSWILLNNQRKVWL